MLCQVYAPVCLFYETCSPILQTLIQESWIISYVPNKTIVEFTSRFRFLRKLEASWTLKKFLDTSFDIVIIYIFFNNLTNSSFLYNRLYHRVLLWWYFGLLVRQLIRILDFQVQRLLLMCRSKYELVWKHWVSFFHFFKWSGTLVSNGLQGDIFEIGSLLLSKLRHWLTFLNTFRDFPNWWRVQVHIFKAFFNRIHWRLIWVIIRVVP